MQSQINTIQRVLGVQLYQKTNNAEESAQAIANWYWWWQKSLDKHTSTDKIFRAARPLSLVGETPVSVKILSDLPGWGPQRAYAAQEHFRGLPLIEVLNGDVDDFMDVKGVGKVLAQAAVDALRRPV